MIARKYRKTIIILTIVTTIITIISAARKFIIGMYLRYRFNINTGNDVGSIGIIGGADGPTSIILSSSAYSKLITIISALLSGLGIIYLIVTSKKKGKQM